MPVPIMDAAQALKANPEKTEDALLKVLVFGFSLFRSCKEPFCVISQFPCFLMQMEQYLLRNHETRKYLQEQAYRLQQGIVTTTTQQAGAAEISLLVFCNNCCVFIEIYADFFFFFKCTLQIKGTLNN